MVSKGSGMASEGGKSREVIAHFEIYKLVISIVIWVLLAAYWPHIKYMAFDDPTVLPINRSKLVTGAFLVPFILLIWAIAMAWHVRAAVANRWVALWIEGGRLVHAHRKILDVPLREISSVEIVTEYQSFYSAFRKIPRRLIVIRANDEKPAKLAASSFREPADEVVSRIRRQLAMRAKSAVA